MTDIDIKRRNATKAIWVTPCIVSVALPMHAQASVALTTTASPTTSANPTTTLSEPNIVSCTNTYQADDQFTVPAGVTQINYTLQGASGGAGGGEAPDANSDIATLGGNGGVGSLVTGTLTVTAGQALSLVVGQVGQAGVDSDHGGSNSPYPSTGEGGDGGVGYGNGGHGGSLTASGRRKTGGGGGGGGGANLGRGAIGGEGGTGDENGFIGAGQGAAPGVGMAGSAGSPGAGGNNVNGGTNGAAGSGNNGGIGGFADGNGNRHGGGGGGSLGDVITAGAAGPGFITIEWMEEDVCS